MRAAGGIFCSALLLSWTNQFPVTRTTRNAELQLRAFVFFILRSPLHTIKIVRDKRKPSHVVDLLHKKVSEARSELDPKIHLLETCNE